MQVLLVFPHIYKNVLPAETQNSLLVSMILKKYKYIDRIKFVRIVLDWSARGSFCLEVAGCRLSDKDGVCANVWIRDKCLWISMNIKQNKFSYIPLNVKEM